MVNTSKSIIISIYPLIKHPVIISHKSIHHPKIYQVRNFMAKTPKHITISCILHKKKSKRNSVIQKRSNSVMKNTDQNKKLSKYDI